MVPVIGFVGGVELALLAVLALLFSGGFGLSSLGKRAGRLTEGLARFDEEARDQQEDA